jgi:hypothetical protein
MSDQEPALCAAKTTQEQVTVARSARATTRPLSSQGCEAASVSRQLTISRSSFGDTRCHRGAPVSVRNIAGCTWRCSAPTWGPRSSRDGCSEAFFMSSRSATARDRAGFLQKGRPKGLSTHSQRLCYLRRENGSYGFLLNTVNSLQYPTSAFLRGVQGKLSGRRAS